MTIAAIPDLKTNIEKLKSGQLSIADGGKYGNDIQFCNVRDSRYDDDKRRDDGNDDGDDGDSERDDGDGGDCDSERDDGDERGGGNDELLALQRVFPIEFLLQTLEPKKTILH